MFLCLVLIIARSDWDMVSIGTTLVEFFGDYRSVLVDEGDMGMAIIEGEGEGHLFRDDIFRR